MSTRLTGQTGPGLLRLQRMRLDLAQIVEPEDWIGMQLIHQLDVEHVHEIIMNTKVREKDITAILSSGQTTVEGYRGSERIRAALRRWKARVPSLATRDIMAHMQQLHAYPLVPEDPLWPQQLADLDSDKPLMLWVRGAVGLLRQPQAAVVGARASTQYGVAAAEDLVSAIMRCEYHVISGGAYGIDAAAHQAALRDTGHRPNAPTTIAVLAGGIDRYYPAGNRDLLRHILGVGAVVSEVVPGRPPSRFRFLSRNRIIAALASLTIVVEAQRRSGALNTAHHALKLGRTVAAVPGSIYAPSSAGCHRLLQETPTELVCGEADIQRLLNFDQAQQPDRDESLDLTQLMVLDCLPVSKYIGLDSIVERTGMTVHHVLAILTQLVQRGYALEREQLWRSAGRASNVKE